MRSLTILLAVLIFAATGFPGDKSSCPAEQAAKAGFEAYRSFHLVVAPLWHNAWPNKDYATLLHAGADFRKASTAVESMKPDIQNPTRKAAFEKYRHLLLAEVDRYYKAAVTNDSEAVYKILPDLHEAFEKGASALVPIDFPELTGLHITTDIIVSKHIPKQNTDGIIASTETVVRKVKGLTKERIPADLKERQKELLADFGKLAELAGKMKECCDKQDMKNYSVHARAMNEKLSDMIATCL